MKLHLQSLADFAWDVVFAIAALRWRKTAPPPPAKTYSPVDAKVASITNLKRKATR